MIHVKAAALRWYRPHLDRSLSLITEALPDRAGAIIDVGAGESTLVDDLLNQGYSDVTVLDISQKALDVSRARLGERGKKVTWLVADILQAPLPDRRYDVWHDRAVFHFLTAAGDRHAYVEQVARAVRPGGHVIVATFGLEGPSQCSGLDVMRYSPEQLHDEFGARQFRLLKSDVEVHPTPFGTTQQFVYCLCRLDTP